MPQEDTSVSEKLRSSFSNVKNDIHNLTNELSNINLLINSQEKDILTLKSNIQSISKDITEIKVFLQNFNKVPLEMKGSVNNLQQSSTINNEQQSSTMIPKTAQNTSQNTISGIREDIQKQFSTLTDREFSAFIAIIELEKQFGEVNYSQLANHLNLTEGTVRGAINRIISKGLPVTKERVFNGKTSLFINKAFHDVGLLNKLIQLRQNPTDQTTFSANF
ncbi:sigma-70 family RNA polymerase sigma factor [Candidatus Woesearchaeota archaeon]|jgi:DNA-binding MarR family transcriptional regulator|nr:sigma-70 family RNA polymerase sigma factor [Candidatus Woesearchaeota archaeon]MBT4208805.1 sigma-70 family RNA polymerase sigma factor [Candidatus Woesearchaeota archaeon]MBT4782998.1 sigma-70 family RNA polymerase sigma factor [Candidatus Woesearchaeota archaeon]MBT5043227.1 sigma-70 family RNA polymerase sigma factor [Candidatus Woesearchaeota archaeon]MBT5111646.1 sigma-70 family RNA polymerase sigma factor [Candidatus Woesearchaeota archaeon]